MGLGLEPEPQPARHLQGKGERNAAFPCASTAILPKTEACGAAVGPARRRNCKNKDPRSPMNHVPFGYCTALSSSETISGIVAAFQAAVPRLLSFSPNVKVAATDTTTKSPTAFVVNASLQIFVGDRTLVVVIFHCLSLCVHCLSVP